MQPFIDSLSQYQVIPARHKMPGNWETSAYAGKKSSPGAAFALTSDFEYLLSGNQPVSGTSTNTKPSAPVTAVEKKAIQDIFSVHA